MSTTTSSTITVDRWEKAVQRTLQSHERPSFQVSVTDSHGSTASGSEPNFKAIDTRAAGLLGQLSEELRRPIAADICHSVDRGAKYVAGDAG